MSSSGARWTANRRLLRCGAAAGPVFVSVFLIEGALRDGYRPLRHPVSSLALGPRGWIQTANFALTGALFVAGAAGLARTACTPDRAGAHPAAAKPAAVKPAAASGVIAPALIAAAGAGLIASAAFATDPVSGYPPGTPDALTQPTRRGTLHNLAALPVFFGLPAAALVSAWRAGRTGDRRFAAYSAATAVTMPAALGVAGAGFGQSPGLVNVAGLFQRVSISAGFGWLTALSLRALRRVQDDRSSG